MLAIRTILAVVEENDRHAVACAGRGVGREVGGERQIGRMRAALPGTSFAVGTVDGIGLEPAFLERHPLPDDARRAPLSELFDRPVVKLLARHEELEPQEFWDLAE